MQMQVESEGATPTIMQVGIAGAGSGIVSSYVYLQWFQSSMLVNARSADLSLVL